MQYDQFVGQVQHRARLASGGEAVRAIHATLQTLSERLPEGEVEDLAAQLPQEIGAYLRPGWRWKEVQRFSLTEFYDRVTEREHIDRPKSIFHARMVIQVLCDAVSAGEIKDVRGLLPETFAPLFDGSADEERKQDA